MLLCLMFIIIASISSSVMDVVYFRWDSSIFSKITNGKILDFIKPVLSWDNKWKNNDYKQGEKFLGSSTVFVFLTDLWHLCKFINIVSLFTICVLYNPFINWYIDIIIMYIIYTVIFELCYSKILINN